MGWYDPGMWWYNPSRQSITSHKEYGLYRDHWNLPAPVWTHFPVPGEGQDPLLEPTGGTTPSEIKGTSAMTAKGKEFGTCTACNTEVNGDKAACPECGGAIKPVAVRVNKTTKLTKTRGGSQIVR